MSIYQLVTTFLLSLYVLGIFQFGLEKVLWQLLPTAVLALVLGRSWQSLITGLIIGLVAQFGAEWFILVGVTLLALGLKFLIRISGHPLFNPAGLGLLLGMLIFSSYPSWWGGENVPLIFLVWIPMLIYKLRRWVPMLAFLLFLSLFNNFSLFFSGSILFFTSVMLIEPMTSPAIVKSGLVYGLVVVFVYQLAVALNFLDPLLVGLISGNLTKVVLDRYIKF